MSVGSSAELRELFAQANELPPDERARFLDRACAENTELRNEVQSLLRTLEQADDFMPESSSRPASANGQAQADAAPVDAWSGGAADGFSAGSDIGPYRVIHWLGEGAFGTVYL